ncbi:MAG: zinc-dependent alcohol dehydrogenase family protein [Gammaproteobacteria bacterium]|nr:zinc-dependent alcohol dehydrogenase family protein [Gammaproteobacteria bacterium]
MKSTYLRKFTQEAGDIEIIDVVKPEPGPGQVCVRMLLSPVNPSDLNYVHGTYLTALQRIIWNQQAGPDGQAFFDPAHNNPCPAPPYALGGEGMGIVESVGSGFLARRLAGKRVAIAAPPPNGVWKENVVVDAAKAVALPDAIADEQGAMFFVNPFTAYVMTREVLSVPRDQWLLVTAAGSALGKSVVRLGKLFGFKTLCVVRSDSNSDELRKLGADAIVETSHQDLGQSVSDITSGRGVGYGIDCVGGDLTADVVRCLGLGGRLLVYGTLANSPLVVPLRDLMMPGAEISGFLLPNWLAAQPSLRLLGVLRTVKRLMIRGMFDTEVTETFALEQVSEAVAAATRPGRTGKVMLRIGET